MWVLTHLSQSKWFYPALQSMIHDIDQANETQGDWSRVARAVPLIQFPEAIRSLRLNMKKGARSPNCG